MQDLIQTYLDTNDVEFKMTCLVNGEEVITYTGTSFDDVSDYAFTADEAFNTYVLNEAADELELAASAELDNVLQEKAQ